MKNLLLCVVIASGLLLGCKNHKNSSPKTESATDSEAADSKSELDKKMEALQQLTPYTIEQMKALLPPEINGDSATALNASENMGTGFASAIYPTNDSTSLEVNIFDCSGIAGAGLYNVHIEGLKTDGKASAAGQFLKVIDFNGDKAMIISNAQSNSTSLTYFAADRLLIMLEGRNYNVEDLLKTARKIKLSTP